MIISYIFLGQVNRVVNIVTALFRFDEAGVHLSNMKLVVMLHPPPPRHQKGFVVNSNTNDLYLFTNTPVCVVV